MGQRGWVEVEEEALELVIVGQESPGLGNTKWNFPLEILLN